MVWQPAGGDGAPGDGIQGPLVAAFHEARARSAPQFTIPGHKGRVGEIAPELVAPLVADQPLHGGLDTPKLSRGILLRSERIAARHFGADWCRFGVGGSTQANLALCLALGRPGDRVIVGRALHRSLFSGLVLSGLDPVWIPPSAHRETGLPLGSTPSALRRAVDLAPQARAVILTDPGYLGTLSPISELARIAHGAGMALVVDQAWGAHFGFHPVLPRHALALGADALVTSVHKTGLGHTQASLACARTGRLERARLERAFDATHTTSPAGSILASIEGSLALMAAHGEELLGRAVELVRDARRQLREALPGVVVPDESQFPGRDGPLFDPLRLVVQLAPLGADGRAVEGEMLRRRVALEYADRDILAPVVTLADDCGTVGRLVSEFVRAVGRTGRGPARPIRPPLAWRVRPEVAMSPREAFFAGHERVAWQHAAGRVSAELVAPYPPGIPVLAPGEVVSAHHLRGLRAAARGGARIAYASDPSLGWLDVVSE